jgi:muramoyltetrapeptide carboxypeptidase LdcA involved in peptidoglycan recycling
MFLRTIGYELINSDVIEKVFILESSQGKPGETKKTFEICANTVLTDNSSAYVLARFEDLDEAKEEFVKFGKQINRSKFWDKFLNENKDEDKKNKDELKK